MTANTWEGFPEKLHILRVPEDRRTDVPRARLLWPWFRSCTSCVCPNSSSRGSSAATPTVLYQATDWWALAEAACKQALGWDPFAFHSAESIFCFLDREQDFSFSYWSWFLVMLGVMHLKKEKDGGRAEWAVYLTLGTSGVPTTR